MKQSNWTKERPYCIYRHTSPSGGVYIGKTQCKNVSHRWGEGGKRYSDAPKFWNAIQKYGWDNFKHEILIDGLTKAEAATHEKRLIAQYNNHSYNIAAGGEGGCGPMSEETRKKIGDANRGKKRTPEEIEKMKLARSNMRHLTNGNINVVSHSDDEYKKYIEMGYYPGRTIKIKENRKNRIWLNDGIKNLLITDKNIHQINEYLKSGYVYGAIHIQRQSEDERIKSNKAKGRVHTSEMREQKSKTMREYGYRWMTNDVENVRVPKWDHEKYLKMGYEFGRMTKHDASGRYI